MSDLPLVTIGIPCYNYAQYIKETLDSVACQTYPNIEIIIVDDFSSDNSREIIEDWITKYRGNIQIKFIKNSVNLGVARTCNIILNNAKGKYFHPLDADDIILSEKIQNQVEVLESAPKLSMVFSNTSVIDKEGHITNPDYCNRIHYDKNNMPSGKIFNDLLIFNFISAPSVLINTECAKKVGGFDETIHVQDYYMWLKLSEKYEIKYMNKITAYYRVHEISNSNLDTTNSIAVESAVTLKYRYYSRCSPELKKVIARNVQNSSVYLYQQKNPSAKKWLSTAFKLKPGFKTFVYYFAIRLRIPFSFFDKIKSVYKNLKG